MQIHFAASEIGQARKSFAFHPLPFCSCRSQQGRQTYRQGWWEPLESKSNRAMGQHNGGVARNRRFASEGSHGGGKWRRRRDSRQHTLVPISAWYMLKYSTPLPLFSRRKLLSSPAAVPPKTFVPASSLSFAPLHFPTTYYSTWCHRKRDKTRGTDKFRSNARTMAV